MSKEKKIRVLLVDDSSLMRRTISDIVNADPACEVIAAVGDGNEAVKAVAILKPDVVLLDIEMPGMDGITALKYLLSEWPTPVIMVTGLKEYEGESTIQCLEYGAVDIVMKPSGPVSLDFEVKQQELLTKIKIASTIDKKILRPHFSKKIEPSQKAQGHFLNTHKVVVIAASTGGPKALAQILPQIDPDINAGIVVIQHMPKGFTHAMASRFNGISQIIVKEAEEGECIARGTALICPGGFHMTLARGATQDASIQLFPKKKEFELAPCADVTMQSLAPVYKGNCLGIILTGMGSDGVEGLRSIQEYGGFTIAEDKSTSIVFGMPKMAIEKKVVNKVLPLEKIPGEMMRWAGRWEQTKH